MVSGQVRRKYHIGGEVYSYLLKLNPRTKEGEEILVDRLSQGKIGHPLLLWESLDQQVQEYLSMLRDSGGVINTSIAIAAATGIIQKKDSNL